MPNQKDTYSKKKKNGMWKKFVVIEIFLKYRYNDFWENIPDFCGNIFTSFSVNYFLLLIFNQWMNEFVALSL